MADNLLPGRYSVGAASVDAGGIVVTPTGATWTDNVWGDDLFFLPSQPLVPPQRVESVNEDGEIVLAYPWPGVAAMEEQYEVRFVGIIERSTAQSRKVLEQLGDVKAWYDIIVEDDAARLALESPTSPLRAGYRVLVKDDGVIWAKDTSAYGDWIGPVEFKGDKGSKGWSPQIVAEADGERRAFKLAGYVGGEGLVPTDNVGQYLKADGTWTSTIGDAVDFRGEGFISRGAYSGATAYAKGDVVRDAGSSWIALQATTGNAPPTLPTTSNAYWELLAQKGQDGTGTGDVVGPASAVNERVAVWDGLTGKLLKDGGKTIAQILAEAIPAGYDDLQFTVTQIALAMADALNVAQFLGPSGNRLADSFDALTYVDVAGATNLNTGVAGVLKPSQAAGIAAVQGADPPTTGPSTGWQGSTHLTFTTPLSNGSTYVTAGAFLTNAGTINIKIVKRNSSTNVDVVATTGAVSHPGGGWADFPLTAPFVVPASGDYFVGFYMSSNTSTTYSSTTRSTTSGDLTGSNQTISAIGTGSGLSSRASTQGAINNLTVRSAAFTAAAVPTKMKALINVKEVDAAVAGTDYTLECSRDNGTTWTAMTLTERYTMPTTGLRVVEAAETDASAQPSGTAPRWRFKTLNNKNVELHDVYLYWS